MFHQPRNQFLPGTDQSSQDWISASWPFVDLRTSPKTKSDAIIETEKKEPNDFYVFIFLRIAVSNSDGSIIYGSRYFFSIFSVWFFLLKSCFHIQLDFNVQGTRHRGGHL